MKKLWFYVVEPWWLLALLTFTGCTTQDEWRAAFASGTIGYTESDGGWGLNKQGHRSGNTHSYAMTYTVQPLAYQSMKMQAELNSRMVTEEMYAARHTDDDRAKVCTHDFKEDKCWKHGRRCIVCGSFQEEEYSP
jgi:hypothetical protein